MSRTTSLSLPSFALTALIAATALACEAPSADAPDASPTAVAAPVMPAAEIVVPVAPAAPEPAAEIVVPVATPELESAPILASGRAPALTPSVPAPAPEPGTSARRTRAPDSLRHPSLLPEGTPEANIAAFTNLPIGKQDAAPIAGVGESGIHLDALEVGKGWASSRCEDPSTSFAAGVDDRVNVCFRVVHPREAETVTLEWSRDGKLRQSIEIGVADTHAYRTRGWMPVSEGRAGSWTATIKSADGFVLGAVDFEIE